MTELEIYLHRFLDDFTKRLMALRSTTGISLIGSNLSGGEFSVEPAKLPGRKGWDYFPPTIADAKAVIKAGANVVRIPFRMERMQRPRDGSLDEETINDLLEVVDYCEYKNVRVLVDMHNYGEYGAGADKLLTYNAKEIAEFANFWGLMTARLKNYYNVIYGLMNEPKQNWATLYPAFNAAIASIRAAGGSQLILVPSAQGSSAEYLTLNRLIPGHIVDPLDNWAIEVHNYFDPNHDGNEGTVVSETIMVECLKSATEAARGAGKQLFLGEFGAGNNPTAIKCLQNGLDYMKANKDVWIGGCLWGYGLAWPTDYALSSHIINGVVKPNMQAVFDYTPTGVKR